MDLLKADVRLDDVPQSGEADEEVRTRRARGPQGPPHCPAPAARAPAGGGASAAPLRRASIAWMRLMHVGALGGAENPCLSPRHPPTHPPAPRILRRPSPASWTAPTWPPTRSAPTRRPVWATRCGPALPRPPLPPLVLLLPLALPHPAWLHSAGVACAAPWHARSGCFNSLPRRARVP